MYVHIYNALYMYSVLRYSKKYGVSRSWSLSKIPTFSKRPLASSSFPQGLTCALRRPAHHGRESLRSYSYALFQLTDATARMLSSTCPLYGLYLWSLSRSCTLLICERRRPHPSTCTCCNLPDMHRGFDYYYVFV